MKYLRYVHALLALAFAAFFLYKVYGKMTNPKIRKVDETMVAQIVQEGSYAAPAGYNITMNTFTTSGFMQYINIFQLVAAILILIPFTRLLGSMIMLPIILNVFLMHVYFDNRPHENVETGILLVANVLLLLFYWKKIKPILWVR